MSLSFSISALASQMLWSWQLANSKDRQFSLVGLSGLPTAHFDIRMPLVFIPDQPLRHKAGSIRVRDRLCKASYDRRQSVCARTLPIHRQRQPVLVHEHHPTLPSKFPAVPLIVIFRPTVTMLPAQ